METLTSATAILGYRDNVAVQLGTKSRKSQYCRYAHAIAKIENPDVEATPGSATTGFNFLGMLTASGSMTGRVRAAMRVALQEAKDKAYRDLLDTAAVDPIILFETEPGQERAWMVPQLSLILDLYNFWVVQSKQVTDQVKDELVYAEPGPDGGENAKAVLGNVEYANRIVLPKAFPGDADIHVADKIRLIYGRLQKIFIKEADSDEGAKGTFRMGKHPMKGWDWMDLTDDGHKILRRRDVRPSIGCLPSWMPLARVVPMFFGRLMGELITPLDDTKVCKNWHPLPGGFNQNYLATTIYCLNSVARYSSARTAANFGLIDDLTWTLMDGVFHPCVDCLKDPKICTKHPQSLGVSTRKMQKRQQPRLVEVQIPQTGAVVFGLKRKQRV